MKKIIILLLIFVFIFTIHSNAQSQESPKSEKPVKETGTVTKSYMLKYISPDFAISNLRPYIWHSSYAPNGKMLTVVLRGENVAEFEKMLKLLDVEKKKILIRVFTVIASKEGKSEEIKNKDLQKVLKELQNVLSFNTYRLDGVSALTVTDGQRHSTLKLSSHSPLELRLGSILIKGESGERSVNFELELSQRIQLNPPQEGLNWTSEELIRTETTVNENGYLVAGVSKIGNGDSLVLVINAEIK